MLKKELEIKLEQKANALENSNNYAYELEMELATEREKIEVLEKELAKEKKWSFDLGAKKAMLWSKQATITARNKNLTERNEVLECGLEGSRKKVNEYAIRNELLAKTIIEQAISIALTQRGVNGL